LGGAVENLAEIGHPLSRICNVAFVEYIAMAAMPKFRTSGSCIRRGFVLAGRYALAEWRSVSHEHRLQMLSRLGVAIPRVFRGTLDRGGHARQQSAS
jgi:hypothetical protein